MPATPAPLHLRVDDASQVGEARRAATAYADALGFGEEGRGRVALVATEAAGNLAKHARGGGALLVQRAWTLSDRTLDDAAGAGGAGGAAPAAALAMEILSVDAGPGMADPARCLADGYSTAGSPGTGLGAMRRLADTFTVDSHPGRGTVLLARVGDAPRGPEADDAASAIGAVNVPYPGETVCGDAWAVVHDDTGLVVLVADGLGHGPAAQAAAAASVQVLFAAAGAHDPADAADAGGSRRGGGPGTQGGASAEREAWVGGVRRAGAPLPAPGDVLARAHAALRPTRGAAVAVAHVDLRTGQLRFAGTGNVAASLLAGSPVGDARSRSLVSHNGIVGHQMRPPQEFAHGWEDDTLLVLASDGLRPQWRLEDYPGLTRRHPALVAGTLWRDHTRGRDDATLVVVRLRRVGAAATMDR